MAVLPPGMWLERVF